MKCTRETPSVDVLRPLLPLINKPVFSIIYSVSQKSRPPKTLRDIVNCDEPV